MYDDILRRRRTWDLFAYTNAYYQRLTYYERDNLPGLNAHQWG